MLKTLKNKKAEGYIDVAVAVLVIALVLVLIISIWSMVTLKQDMDIASLEEGVLNNASYFGRIFARSGGLSEAAAQALKEQNIDFEAKPVVCDGIEACRTALLKLSKNIPDGNFIEGMACLGGCIGGAGCLTHGEKNKREVDKYGQEALEKNISDAVSVLK